MKKVIIFVLVIALALGGIVFAHAAVTASQDDLTIYPTLELGDRSTVEGLTASMVFTCGDHLSWQTDYAFTGETSASFSYHWNITDNDPVYPSNRFEFQLDSGVSGGGDLTLNRSPYADLFQAVADQTPAGGETTMEVKLAEYADYYFPSYEISYWSSRGFCAQGTDLLDTIGGISVNLNQKFRFPVQKDQLAEVGITRDPTGNIDGFDFYLRDHPLLYFITAMNDQGVWFLPVFRTETGEPLPYESPSGHGIYFMPWVEDSSYGSTYNGNPIPGLSPNMARLTQVVSLPEDLTIVEASIDGVEATILTLEDGAYILTVYDLATGGSRRLEVLPFDGEKPLYGYVMKGGDYLLVTAQGHLALVENDTMTLLLTAPDVTGQTCSAISYSPDLGTLRFEDGILTLSAAVPTYQDGTFWIAAWRQGELLYYGEYDCSLMRGNDRFYYGLIAAQRVMLESK